MFLRFASAFGHKGRERGFRFAAPRRHHGARVSTGGRRPDEIREAKRRSAHEQSSFQPDRAAIRAVQRPREALLIMAIARHPWLLDEHLEEIASLHLDDAGCCRIRNAMLTIHQTEEALDNEKLLEHLSREGYGAELERT